MESTETRGSMNPVIERIIPRAALPGGEVRIVGRNLRGATLAKPRVLVGGSEASIVISSEDSIIARIPEVSGSSALRVSNGTGMAESLDLKVGLALAENLHPVANPAVDAEGNIYATFSGSRGQKVPVSIYKIDSEYQASAFVTDVVNATGIAFNHQGDMFVSSRLEGTVYRVTPNGKVNEYAGGMGIATGIAFDRNGNLYAGDRSGTIFKIDSHRQTFVFATLEPSVSAYHLAFAENGDLFVTGPTLSSNDAVFRIDPHGVVTEYFRGLGRPQGMAFDVAGNLYVAASFRGWRGMVRITPKGEAEMAVAGQGIVGMAFAPGKTAVVATANAVYYLDLGVEGLALFG